MSKKSNHYLDNKEFERIIAAYKKEPKKNEEALIRNLDILIENILQSFKFNVEKEDAKQECFLLILRTLKNFNPESGSAFNYFTTVILNNLKLIYTKNKRYTIKLKNYADINKDKFI